mgnify:CR=1 FL=1
MNGLEILIGFMVGRIILLLLGTPLTVLSVLWCLVGSIVGNFLYHRVLK